MFRHSVDSHLKRWAEGFVLVTGSWRVDIVEVIQNACRPETTVKESTGEVLRVEDASFTRSEEGTTLTAAE